MTELLARPRSRTGGDAPAPRPPAGERVGRPLAVSATLAGCGAALAGLTVFAAVAVTGWFLADGGAHGDTTDALRVGADAWLVGHGSRLSFGGVDYTVVPLGLTALLAWAAYRGGAWAARVSPPRRDRELAQAAALLTSSYVVVAVVASVVAGTPEVRGSLARTLVGALLVSVLAGGSGLLSGSGRWDAVGDLLPGWVWPLVRSAAAGVLGVLMCSAGVVVLGLVLGFGSSASLISQLDLRGGDAVMLVLLTALLAPNAVLLGAAYLLGPGFSVGVGTTVSPGLVLLGPLPSFPLLSALPDAGHGSWVTTAFLVAPGVATLLGVMLVQRRHPVFAWDLGALRGAGAGVLAGVATALLTGLGGGALGNGRLAEVGAPVGAVVVAGVLTMGLGGLLGGLLMTLLQRRGLLTGEVAAAAATEDDADEPTVEVARMIGQYRRDRPPPPASVREREAQDLLQRLVTQKPDDEDTVRLI